MQRLKGLVKSVCSPHILLSQNSSGGPGALKIIVSIAIVNDAQFQILNKRFLNRRGSSDCLSFDLSDDPSGPSRIFEIIVNGELAAREAKVRGHSGEAELALYITHGLLHNLGFDDSTKRRAAKMHRTEDKILQRLGYGFVYNKSAQRFQI